MKYGYTDSWSDFHDYLQVIDAGYITTQEFLDFNIYKKIYTGLLDSELHSMAMSN